MTDRPSTERIEQVIRFVYRMREPDIVRPDEENSLRHLLSLVRAEGRQEAVRDLEALSADLVNDHRGIPYDVIERIDRVVAGLNASEPPPPPETSIDAHWRETVERYASESPPADLDEAWKAAEASLPDGGRLTAIFEMWDRDMRRIGHRGLVRGHEDAAAALLDLARVGEASDE